MNKIIVTGSAGFIGSSLCIKLLEKGNYLAGIDNHNDYYDPKIKESRLQRLAEYSNYNHYRVDLSDKNDIEKIFKDIILFSFLIKKFITFPAVITSLTSFCHTTTTGGGGGGKYNILLY